MRETRMHFKFRLENLKGRNYLEGLGIDGMKILRWILKKQDVKVWTGFIWLRILTSGVLL
jgi:hypothetical protein